MKACLITNFPFYSGTGKVTYETWHQLNNQGLCQADLFLTQYIMESDRQIPENKNVKVLLPFNFLTSPFLSRLLFYFVDPFLIPKNYDVYHIGNHMMGRFAPFLRPSVVTVHDLLQFYYPEVLGNPLVSKIYNLFMESSLKTLAKANHLICVSEFARQEVFKFLKKVDPDNVSVIYNGLSHSAFYPSEKEEARAILNLPKEKRIILHVGSEIRKKRIPLLIRSFKILKEKYPDLILVRCGEKTLEIQNLIKSLGLENDVYYFEFKNDEESMARVYNSADVLVMCSEKEGFGFPVAEAMACGIPVVSGNFTSLGEVCGSAQAAEIEVLDEDHLVSAVSRVLGMSDSELEKVKAKGIENAQRFSWEENARQTLAVYEKVIESSKSKTN